MGNLRFFVRLPGWQSPPHSREGEFVGFLGPFLCGETHFMLSPNVLLFSNPCGVKCLASLRSLGLFYILWSSIIRYIYHSFERVKRCEKHKGEKTIPYNPWQPPRNCHFPKFQPLDGPIILPACWGHIGLHFGRLDHRFELWFVDYSFWSEADVLVISFLFVSLLLIIMVVCSWIVLRTLWRTLDWFV